MSGGEGSAFGPAPAAERHIDNIAAVAVEFVETWDDAMLADEIAKRLSCREVDALVALMRATGCDYAAAIWMRAHQAGDEPGDSHYRSGA